jgi:uncharacterized protein YecT (DUF1311 family)
MSILLDADFFAAIREVRDHWPWKPQSTASPQPLIADAATVFSDLDRVFELRHIVCHEFAYPVQVSRSEAERLVTSVESFLSATNFLVLKLLFRDVPDTQQDRNVYFVDRFQAADKELRVAIEAAESAFKGDRLKSFGMLQKLWDTYRQQDAEFVAAAYEGGTIRPQIHAQRLEHLTRQRIRGIQELVESQKP